MIEKKDRRTKNTVHHLVDRPDGKMMENYVTFARLKESGLPKFHISCISTHPMKEGMKDLTRIEPDSQDGKTKAKEKVQW